MALQRIKKNDLVLVTTGKSKGVEGKVLRILGEKVWVEGANLVKKHVRPNPQSGEQGGILDREAPVHVSNVALVLAAGKSGAKRQSKVGIKTLDDGRKVRFYKTNGEFVDVV